MLEPNTVPWAVGDAVENPKYPVQGGEAIGIYKRQMTATNPDFQSKGISLLQDGMGVTNGYMAMLIVNQNTADLYVQRGGSGVLAPPTLFQIGGEWGSLFTCQSAPASGETLFEFQNFAGGQPGSPYTQPINLFNWPISGGSFGYDPTSNTYSCSYFTIYDQLTVNGAMSAGVVQAAGITGQGGSYGQSQLIQPINSGFDTYPTSGGDGTIFNFRTWSSSTAAYNRFNDGGNLVWSYGKNPDNSFTIQDAVDNSTEILHAASGAGGLSFLTFKDTTNGHTYRLTVVNGVLTLTQVS